MVTERNRYFGGRQVPPPRKGSGSWAPSCINAVLQRERYRGQITWGRFRNTDRGGRTRVRSRQPERQWTVVDLPELRIVDEDLWTAVQSRRSRARMDAAAQSPKAATAGGAPRMSASLLSGLAICATCSGPITMSGSGKRTQCYGCSYYRNRGATVCSNSWLEAIPSVDGRLLAEIEKTVLTPEARRYTLDRAAEVVRARLDAQPDRLPALRSELARTTREVENLLRAVETGRCGTALLDRLTEKEAAVKRLTREIQSVESMPVARAFDLARVDRLLGTHLDRLGELLHGDLVMARKALQKLLVDRVRFAPVAFPDGSKTYRLEAELTLGRVLAAEVNNKVYVPDGI